MPTTQQETVQFDNSDYVNANIIAIRLNTDPIMQQIEFFLRGKEPQEILGDDGVRRTILVDYGVPKANQKGIQAILYRCRGLINAQVVQGNYSNDFYLQSIKLIRISLAMLIFENLYNWELEELAIDEITDFIMDFVEPFLSRLIGNKERDSYSQSLQAKEINTNTGDKTFPFLGK